MNHPPLADRGWRDKGDTPCSLLPWKMERETLGTKRQLPWPFGGCATEREYEGLKKYE